MYKPSCSMAVELTDSDWTYTDMSKCVNEKTSLCVINDTTPHLWPTPHTEIYTTPRGLRCTLIQPAIIPAYPCEYINIWTLSVILNPLYFSNTKEVCLSTSENWEKEVLESQLNHSLFVGINQLLDNLCLVKPMYPSNGNFTIYFFSTCTTISHKAIWPWHSRNS